MTSLEGYVVRAVADGQDEVRRWPGNELAGSLDPRILLGHNERCHDLASDGRVRAGRDVVGNERLVSGGVGHVEPPVRIFRSTAVLDRPGDALASEVPLVVEPGRDRRARARRWLRRRDDNDQRRRRGRYD